VGFDERFYFEKLLASFRVLNNWQTQKTSPRLAQVCVLFRSAHGGKATCQKALGQAPSAVFEGEEMMLVTMTLINPLFVRSRWKVERFTGAT
jgi:hypothetical protein